MQISSFGSKKLAPCKNFSWLLNWLLTFKTGTWKWHLAIFLAPTFWEQPLIRQNTYSWSILIPNKRYVDFFTKTNPWYELFSVWDWNDLGTGWQESESLGIRWNGNHIINTMQWILHPNFFAFSLWLSVKWWCFSIF